ncbi:MAG: YitT family protein [Anaerovoracaceae bacterium]|nr:YitT family protein [Anaerovoracaceae bacterium]
MKRIEKPTKEKVKMLATDAFVALLACSIGAFSLQGVMIPNGLTSGGLTGIARVIQTYTSLNFSLIYYAGAIIILALVAIFLGFREVRKILFMTILFPATLLVFERFPLELLQENDVILAAIFCGIFNGICTGLVFWRGYSFCGTDAIAKIVKKKWLPHIDLSQILLVIDVIIIVGSAFVFGRNIALYALITQVIFAKTIDYVMFGFETKIVKLEIITDKKELITKFIMEELMRGVSCSQIVGEFTGELHFKLEVLCSPRESIVIRRFVANYDSDILMTAIHVDTVWGNGPGFTDIAKD